MISWFRGLIRSAKFSKKWPSWIGHLIYHAADTDLLLWGMRKHPGNEDAVRNELQPSIDKTRCFSWPQNVEGVAEKRNVFYYPFKDWSTSYRSSAISNISVKLPPPKKHYLLPWSTKPVLSRWGILVEIAKNILYGSKLYIFLLCQKWLGY